MAQPLNPKRRSLPLPDWRSDLPEDLLESIGQRLASGHDTASFRSACSPWRAAVPFVTFGPLLLLPFDPDSNRVGFYCVPEKKVLSKTLPDVRDKVACSSWRSWMRVHSRWVLHPTNDYGDTDAAGRAIKLEDMRDVFFREIVLSAPPNVAGRECVPVAMLGCSTEVAFCRVGVDSA
ncbi:uncharacterized protein [Miscanthus floridulus]|uniref:uncharacterized protein n=1 Tax=Miscanthus floridulus TaxID=154761 RepID=UPI003459DCDF